jgi:hypothetical protein
LIRASPRNVSDKLLAEERKKKKKKKNNNKNSKKRSKHNMEYNRARQGNALPPDIYLGLRFGDADEKPTSDMTPKGKVSMIYRPIGHLREMCRTNFWRKKERRRRRRIIIRIIRNGANTICLPNFVWEP